MGKHPGSGGANAGLDPAQHETRAHPFLGAHFLENVLTGVGCTSDSKATPKASRALLLDRLPERSLQPLDKKLTISSPTLAKLAWGAIVGFRGYGLPAREV
jgi:hypothetical protein